MEITKRKIKYFLYVRKSSESEDRQVQSIDDQINRLKELAGSLDLKIVKTFTESKSAKKPNNRPKFAEMVEMIKDGEADGILCWQINRLSRNPIDSAQVQWLLQEGVLKSIQTIDRQYLPDDNVLLFNVESGMANQFILDLKKNVTRGMYSKAERGWMPGQAPIGYLNDRSTKTIIKDPERFETVRKIWDLMLTGKYSVPSILDIVNDDWGFKQIKKRKVGGCPMSRSVLYKMLTSLFYTGIFKFGKKQYQGKHEPMISLEEYDRVQEILGRAGKPRPKQHEFAFTGIITCGECGSMITACEKRKFVKSENKFKTYVYYACTKRKKGVKCNQKPITLKNLEDQIDNNLKKITILPEFKDWALEVLRKNNDQEIEDRSNIYETQHKALTSTQNELDNLTKMRYRDLINDETFIKERDILQNKIVRLREKLRNTEKRADDWLELTEKAFHFATYARIHFKKGSLDAKRDILRTVGTKFIMRDKILQLSHKKWLQTIEKDYPKLESGYKRLEPLENVEHKQKSEDLTSLRSSWCSQMDLNHRPPRYKRGALTTELWEQNIKL